MKNRDSKLDRLFKAARSASAPALPEQMPAHLKTRVLAHWRSGAAEAERVSLSLAALFRTALVCAGLAMLVCAAWSSADPSPEWQSEEALANYELREELKP